MKKKLLMFTFTIFMGTISLKSQTPPHPTPSGPPGNLSGYTGPVQSPIDGGFTILLALAGVYAGRKSLKLIKK
jgi:hypothetical protein